MGLTGGAGVLLVTAAVGHAQTTQTKPPDYRTLIVQSYKQKAPATLGYNCVPAADGTGGTCSELPKYPLDFKNTVTIRPGGEVTLLTAARASYVNWRAARIDGRGEEVITAKGEAKAVTKTGKRWRIELPRRMHRSTDLLGFDVIYPNAYASFEIGAKIGKTVPAKKKTSTR